MGGYSEQCELCGKWYTSYTALSDHIRAHIAKAKQEETPYELAVAEAYKARRDKGL